jgi:hypothetical protein
MKKRTMKEILKDVQENLTDWETDVKNVGQDHFFYDRHNWIEKFQITPELETKDDIYWSDVETIRVLLLQMFLFQQQIFEDEWTEDVIDRHKKVRKMKINENNEDENCEDDLLQGKFRHFKGCITTDGKDEVGEDVETEKVSKTDDRKIIESFVWYSFSTLTDQQIKDCIKLFKTDFKDYFIDDMKKKLSKDEVFKQVDRVTDTIDKFVDKIGLSKNEWKKMLEIYK